MATRTAPNGTATATQWVAPLARSARSPPGVHYRLAGDAALTVVGLVPIGVIVFFLWPRPTTVTGVIAQFHRNPIVGFLDQDLLKTPPSVGPDFCPPTPLP